MAEVFRPIYTAPDPRTGGRIRKKSPTWWIRYYTPDGCRHKVKGYRDKKATEAMAAELERRGIRQDAGMFDPLDVHAKRPLAEHLADYVRYLAGKGDTPAHVALSETRVLVCIDACRFVKIADVQPSAVITFLASLRKPSKAAKGRELPGRSITTINYYLTAIKGFTRWLWRDRRTAVDPLAGIAKLANAGSEIRHGRRDFSPEELDWLLRSARNSNRTFRGLSGLDRFYLYLTAAGTGLRVSELASLTPSCFKLLGGNPAIRLHAAYAKNRKDAEQPLAADLAEALRHYLAVRPPNSAVWPGTWTLKAALMLRRDLADARENWLESFQEAEQRRQMAQADFLAYRNAEDLVGDFHAFRHTYISRLVRGGASAKVAQILARHSTVQLTLGRYAHAGHNDLASAVNSLPSILPPENLARADVGVLQAAPGAVPSSSSETGQALACGPFPETERTDIRLAEIDMHLDDSLRVVRCLEVIPT